MKLLRRTIILLAALFAVCGLAPCLADTVYLNDGSKIEGSVTDSGDTYTIQTSTQPVEVKKTDVVYVSSRPAGAMATSSPTASKAPTALASADAGVPVGVGLTLSGDYQMPESPAFLLMRKLSTTLPGSDSLKLRQELEQWRAFSHERRRRIGSEWVLPKDFSACRSRYEETLKTASDILSKAKSSKAKTQAVQGGYSKLCEAAILWKDPLVRDFLRGIAEFESGNFGQAQGLFQKCHKDAPNVAAFAQGEAMALLDQDKASEAIAPAADFLRLKPDSLDALNLLRRALSKAPGADMKQPAVIAAKDLVHQYQDTPDSPAKPAATKTYNWAMPMLMPTGPAVASSTGKAWINRDNTLPSPPYDRLVFRQAVAVPISDNTLLIDANIVAGACDIFVRIDKALVPATVRTVTLAKAPAVPLAVLNVAGCAFTPAGRAEGGDLAGKAVTLYTIPMFDEMGSQLQTRQGKVLSVGEDGPAVTPGVRILPGESAGPVLTDDGQLLEFLGGKIDVTAENGGVDQALPLSQMDAYYAPVKGKTSVAAKLKRTYQPILVTDKAFVVYVICVEKFDNY
jgi:tetratricopeptide (TPR) repeat protein